MKVLLLTVISTVLVVTGCASATGTLYSEMPSYKSSEKFELTIFRQKQFTDGGSCYVVLLDGSEWGVLANGGFLKTFVEPGEHTITIPHLDDKELEVLVQSSHADANFVEYGANLEGVGVIPAGYATISMVNMSFDMVEVESGYAIQRLAELRDSSEERRCLTTHRSLLD